MRRICIVIVLGLLVGTNLSAQEASGPQKAKRIERVLIRGNVRITASTIKPWIAIRKGDSYNPALLDLAVKVLFDTGHFVEVKVFAEEGRHGGRIVTFELREKSLIEGIAFEGIDQATQQEVSEEWRKQEIDMSEGSDYDPLNVKQAAAVIQDVLVRRGDRQVKVIPMVEQQTPATVSIVFKVEG